MYKMPLASCWLRTFWKSRYPLELWFGSSIRSIPAPRNWRKFLTHSQIKSRNQPWLLPDSGTADPCRGRTSTSKRPRSCPGMSWEVLLHCSLSKDCTPLHHLWLERCTDMLGINMKELLYNNAQKHTKHCIVFWSLLPLSGVVQAAHLLWAGSCWIFGRGLLQCLSSADIIRDHPKSSVPSEVLSLQKSPCWQYVITLFSTVWLVTGWSCCQD